jgi:hypothetical protein
MAKVEASSTATYGHDGVVWAEAFTGTDHAHAWHETLDYLKALGDLWLSQGINRFCFHCWVHSPSLTQKPGNTFGPWGIHFDRNNTWFDLSTGYLTYLARCQHLLQQGLPVTDVVVFSGDKVTDFFPTHPALPANGYDYHGLSSEILSEATVRDGSIALPSGMRYRLLITYEDSMKPATIRKLQELVQAGATIMGVKPTDAPGLAGYPGSVAEVRKIADEMWGTDRVAAQQGHVDGKGKVYWTEPGKSCWASETQGNFPFPAEYLDCSNELAVLKAIGVAPDFSYGASGKEDNDHMLISMHRRIGDVDFYFVSNQANAARSENCTFRITSRQPELWDAVTGEMRSLPGYTTTAGGGTMIRLKFEPGQSFFVVFQKPEEGKPVAGKNFSELQPVLELGGPWEVSFDPKWGGPDKIQFEKLEDWTKRPEEGIKYYSGKATYRKAFDYQRETNRHQRLFLDLGTVKDLAEVRLNGKTLGVVWCAPWRIEITDAVKSGSNQLELVVVDEWVNRLIKDSGLPPEKRLTWTTWNPYKPRSPLLPSGLLGPVRVMAEETVTATK